MEIDQCDTGSKNDDDTGEASTNDDHKDISCPLFMDGLPLDFSTNPALAAIASLMNDNDNDGTPVVASTKKPSTNQAIIKRNERTKYKPYIKSNRKTKATPEKCIDDAATSNMQVCDKGATNYSRNTREKTSMTTIGEASLFLKMWKL